MKKGKIGLLLLAFAVVAAVVTFGWSYAKNQIIPDATEELSSVSMVRQVVAKDNQIGRTIMWQSEDELINPAVEYRLAGSDDIKKVPVIAESFSDDGEDMILYRAELRNLPQAAKMEYRIIVGEESGIWHKLTTDDGSDFTALVFPDSQSSDYSGWADLAQKAHQRNSEAKFFINMGDLVDNGEDQSQWRAWFRSVSTFSADIPVAPLMGNHETYSREWKVRQPVAYLAEFAVPENGSAKYERFYYSYDYGPVHFIVLNTQQGELSELDPDLLDEEIAWFRQDVAASTKPWNVVLMHKDTLQYRIEGRPERREGFSEDGEIWMPLFDEAGIDAVLSAHLHTYRNRGHIKNFTRDASGPLYILTGVAGSVRYPGLWTDHALDEYVAPQPETDNYMIMKANDTQLDFYSYLHDGTEIDHAVVTK